MNREEIEKIVEEAAHKQHKHPRFNVDKVRAALNAIFMVVGLVGVITYFTFDHRVGIGIVGAAILLKIVEFFLRFMF